MNENSALKIYDEKIGIRKNRDIQCRAENTKHWRKIFNADTLRAGNRDLSSFHCHFSRMLDKTMAFVPRFCPRACHARALEF